MDNFIKALLEGLAEVGEEDKEEIVVGKVNPFLAKRLADHDERMDALKELVNAQLKLVALKVKAEYQPHIEKLENEHKAIWAAVFDDLGVPEGDRGKSHRLRRSTSELYRVE